MTVDLLVFVLGLMCLLQADVGDPIQRLQPPFERPVMTPEQEAEQEAKARRWVEAQIPAMEIEGATLSETVDALRKASGANVFVNWRAMEGVGVDRSDRLWLKTEAMPLGRAISLILRKVETPDAELAHWIEDGIIYISTWEHLALSSVATRAYDIRDVVGRAEDERRARRLEALQLMIRRNVEPRTWEGERPVGEMHFRGGQLIVTNTADAHERIEELLEQVRALVE